jgi:hypothetical protein
MSETDQRQCNVGHRAYRDANSHNRNRNKRKPHTPLEHRIISKLNWGKIEANYSDDLATAAEQAFSQPIRNQD